MTDLLYFTFQLATTTYGVESQTVVEVFFLPELTSMPGLPQHVVGVLNVRGTIVPVLDLDVRLGQMPQPYQTSDRVIVLAARGQRFGVIVQDVYGIEQLTPEQIQAPVLTLGADNPERESAPQNTDPVQMGWARRQHEQHDIIVLLDTDQMLVAPQHPQSIDLSGLEREPFTANDASNATAETLASEHQETHPTPLLRHHTPFCPDATPAERQIFHDRAQQLAPSPSPEHLALEQQTALAIIELSNEWFGLPVETIREFTEIQHLTPIPACPPHILGHTNLRGEIITLVDMSTFLDLPPLAAGDRWPAVIVDIIGITFGIVVSGVIDIYLYNPTQQKSMPLAVQGVARELIEGAIDYHGTMVSRLNLARLLTQAEFIVQGAVL